MVTNVKLQGRTDVGDIKSPLWKLSREVRAATWRVTHVCMVITSLRLNRVASGRETLMRAGCERTEVKRVVGTRETFPEQRALECVENGKWFVTPCRRFPGGSVVKHPPAVQDFRLSHSSISMCYSQTGYDFL